MAFLEDTNGFRFNFLLTGATIVFFFLGSHRIAPGFSGVWLNSEEFAHGRSLVDGFDGMEEWLVDDLWGSGVLEEFWWGGLQPAGRCFAVGEDGIQVRKRASWPGSLSMVQPSFGSLGRMGFGPVMVWAVYLILDLCVWGGF